MESEWCTSLNRDWCTSQKGMLTKSSYCRHEKDNFKNAEIHHTTEGYHPNHCKFHGGLLT